MPPYVNWLAVHDEHAETLQPARSFIEYSHFLLIRFPRLQPVPPEDPIELRSFEILRRSFLMQIATHGGFLPSRAAEGLTSPQIDQLSALIIDLGGDEDHFEIYGTEANQWRQIGREGPQKQKRLTKQVERVRTALTKLRDLAEQMPPLLGKRYKTGAECCLDDLDTYCTPISDEALQKQVSIHQREDDPGSFAVVPLYWFFRHECGQSGNESEVRAAILRNQFLTPPDKEPLRYQAELTGGESGGCSAVRLAVSRYHPEAQVPLKTHK